MRFPSKRAGWILAIWLGVAVFTSVQNVVVRLSRRGGGTIDWQWDVVHEFVYALTWAACTGLILGAARRWRLGPGGDCGAVPRHLGLMLAVAPVQTLATYVLNYLLLSAAGTPPAAGLARWLVAIGPGIVWATFNGFLYYWLILGVHAAVVYPRMYQAERVTAAELATRAAHLEGA